LRWFAVSVRKPPHSARLSTPRQKLVDPINLVIGDTGKAAHGN
jgi:hypothetical protein